MRSRRGARARRVHVGGAAVRVARRDNIALADRAARLDCAPELARAEGTRQAGGSAGGQAGMRASAMRARVRWRAGRRAGRHAHATHACASVKASVHSMRPCCFCETSCIPCVNVAFVKQVCIPCVPVAFARCSKKRNPRSDRAVIVREEEKKHG
eukprot:142695-Chlamydomonas_euryale.AAC.1